MYQKPTPRKLTADMKVWIVQTGEPLHCDGGEVRPMRAMNLADTLCARGHVVTIWSSDFFHQEKRHRYGRFVSVQPREGLTINLIPSLGYSKNIGVGRLADHAILAFRLRKLLQAETFARPDAVFVGYPPIEVAAVAIEWCRQVGVPSIIDVKDQWPSLFLDAVPHGAQPIARALFDPYFRLARRAIGGANHRCAMSTGYLDWISNFAQQPRSEDDIIAPLTVREPSVSEVEERLSGYWWRSRGVDISKRNKFIFVGSFMSVFNFEEIGVAARELDSLGVDCQFVICGAGGNESQIRRLMSKNANVVFPGWVDLPQIVSLSKAAIAAIVPYKNIDNFTLNIPNKVVDALALGLPIISTLDGEVGRLIRENDVGFCAADADGDALAVEMKRMLLDQEWTKAAGERARRLYSERFRFESVYGALADRIESMVR
jgi:glycosyltransferase involved in cell wall biosynthesis